MIKKCAFILVESIFCIGQAWALYTKPWLGDVYAFQLDAAFTYDRYKKVQDAAVQLKHPSNDKLYALCLGFTPSDAVDLQAEIEFAATPRQPFGWRSIALQGRYLWLNDIQGDLCSVITAINIREVSGHSVRDISSPYHYYFNAELNTSLGKEWSTKGWWTIRSYGLGAIGTANRGSPWLRFMGVFEANIFDTHRFLFDIESYFGLGSKKHVDVDRFHGWARVHHQSIDLGATYAYHMRIWGAVGVKYAYRVFAKSFPEHVYFITFFYTLPFSLF